MEEKRNTDNLVMENGNPADLYADVTICVPHATLGGEEVVLDVEDEKKLIDVMIEEGLLVITPRIGLRAEHCNYPIGKLTKKFFNEVYGEYFTSKPARSCVAVKDLPKGALVEVEVIASK